MKKLKILVEEGKISMAPPLGQQITKLGGNPGKIINELKKKIINFKKKKIYVEILVNNEKEIDIKIIRFPLTQIVKDVTGIEKFSEKKIINEKNFKEIYEKQKNFLNGKEEKKKKESLIGSLKTMKIFLKNEIKKKN